VDGKGYPDGLDGNEIPLPARIVLVADALDAMTSDRPYRTARHLDAAMDELRVHAGSHFCPTVIAALEEIYRDEPHVLADGQLHVVPGGLGGDGDWQAEPFERVADPPDLPLARVDQR
jgi:HD-GYP domain-containing protein (c-di-GMP phosphodiesterase class II)